MGPDVPLKHDKDAWRTHHIWNWKVPNSSFSRVVLRLFGGNIQERTMVIKRGSIWYVIVSNIKIIEYHITNCQITTLVPSTLEFYYVYFKFQEVCALFQLTFKNIDITTWNQTIKKKNNANRMQDAWHLMHLNIIIWYLINYNSALLVVIVCTKWTTNHYFNT